MAIAATLKFKAPDDGMRLYSASHFEDSEYAGFGLAGLRPEGGSVEYEPYFWESDEGEPGPPLSESSIEQLLMDIEEHHGRSLILKPPLRAVKWTNARNS